MIPTALLAAAALANPAADGALGASPAPGPGPGDHPGLYDNRIANTRLDLPFIEICWRAGEIAGDNHIGGGKTAGGACNPGDAGFLITQESVGDLSWAEAKMTCATYGMRLPEITELNAAACWAPTLGITSPKTEWGWAGNRPELVMSAPGSKRAEATLVVPVVRACNQLRPAVATTGQLDACGQDCDVPPPATTPVATTFCVF